jgi:hypothetical protein
MLPPRVGRGWVVLAALAAGGPGLRAGPLPEIVRRPDPSGDGHAGARRDGVGVRSEKYDIDYKIPPAWHASEVVWQRLVDASSHGSLACRPGEDDSDRHCICRAGWRCAGSECVTGHAARDRSPVEGYKKGCVRRASSCMHGHVAARTRPCSRPCEAHGVDNLPSFIRRGLL